jgi:hypothetical protein
LRRAAGGRRRKFLVARFPHEAVWAGFAEALLPAFDGEKMPGPARPGPCWSNTFFFIAR